jgi:hypothetical protein
MEGLSDDVILDILKKLNPIELATIADAIPVFKKVARNNKQTLMKTSLKIIKFDITRGRVLTCATKKSEIDLDLLWDVIGSEFNEESMKKRHKKLSYKDKITVIKTINVISANIDNIVNSLNIDDKYSDIFDLSDYIISHNAYNEFLQNPGDFIDSYIDDTNDGPVGKYFIPLSFLGDIDYIDPKIYTYILNELRKNTDPDDINVYKLECRTPEIISRILSQ